jgi:hypothetical protein
MNHKQEFLKLYSGRLSDSIYAQIQNITNAYKFDYSITTGSGNNLMPQKSMLVEIECKTPDYEQTLKFYLK